ncbi:MAG TPA: hypothetical protein VMP89_14035 [Solirubrobacteraceae bacterium]|nr:hypothetical protein [Solirubrobacteraceae bacterium]
MSTTPTFNPALVGQTESAFGAILDRELAGTGLNGPRWVALNLALAGEQGVDRVQLIRRLAAARNVDEPEARECVNDLAVAGLLHIPDEESAPVTVTDAGRQLHGQVNTAVAGVTQRLWGDLAAEDVATAARVLSTVLARARQELSQT